jgi:hypothetical protein
VLVIVAVGFQVAMAFIYLHHADPHLASTSQLWLHHPLGCVNVFMKIPCWGLRDTTSILYELKSRRGKIKECMYSFELSLVSGLAYKVSCFPKPKTADLRLNQSDPIICSIHVPARSWHRITYLTATSDTPSTPHGPRKALMLLALRPFLASTARTRTHAAHAA